MIQNNYRNYDRWILKDFFSTGAQLKSFTGITLTVGMALNSRHIHTLSSVYWERTRKTTTM